MNNFHDEHSTKAGTFGGTLLILLLNIQREEIVKTVVLAAIGAAVSFFISILLKYVVRAIRRK